MKKFIFFLNLCFAVNFSGGAQSQHFLSGNISINQFDFAYKYSCSKLPVKPEIYFGLGNQDIESQFNDLVMGIRLHYTIYSGKRMEDFLYLGGSAYFPNNEYYEKWIPTLHIGLVHHQYLFKNKSHCLILKVGLQKGEKEYMLLNENSYFTSYYTTQLILPAFQFSIGYGYKF